MTKSNDFYILKQEKFGYDVVKVEASDAPHSIRETGRYSLLKGAVGYSCDCQGYVHRKECKHIHMPNQNDSAKSVSLEVARGVVSRFINDLKPFYKKVGLPDEAYERDSSGMVRRVTLELHGCVNTDTHLHPGVWEGMVKDCGVVLRLVIT